ncbi:hypothetical protein [Curtobacterium sp. P97]|uniref:hypothetical protein n=1 Tax=Curtobacterium sp. P97 TaxID=2939562 RepID=UPI002041516C|nr:hypothetical protein [Curtobacterium sp. P97]MCM3521974.1 hypothetical protein [Curtobacterium sp. P97]
MLTYFGESVAVTHGRFAVSIVAPLISVRPTEFTAVRICASEYGASSCLSPIRNTFEACATTSPATRFPISCSPWLPLASPPGWDRERVGTAQSAVLHDPTDGELVGRAVAAVRLPRLERDFATAIVCPSGHIIGLDSDQRRYEVAASPSRLELLRDQLDEQAGR